MKYRYYSKLRPIDLGTYPTEGAQDIHNFDSRTYVEEAGCEVWGYIDYDRKLTDAEVKAYELVQHQDFQTDEMRVALAKVDMTLIMRCGETIDEAKDRLSKLLDSELCNLADHHIECWIEDMEEMEDI